MQWVAANGKLPVVTFTAGGIATPADAALCMQLGADGVFVGSGIFKSGDPAKRARAIVEATTNYMDAERARPRLRGSRRGDGRDLDLERSTRPSCSRRAAGSRPGRRVGARAVSAQAAALRGGRVKKFSLPAVAIEAEALISRQSAAAATICAKR